MVKRLLKNWTTTWSKVVHVVSCGLKETHLLEDLVMVIFSSRICIQPSITKLCMTPFLLLVKFCLVRLPPMNLVNQSVLVLSTMKLLKLLKLPLKMSMVCYWTIVKFSLVSTFLKKTVNLSLKKWKPTSLTFMLKTLTWTIQKKALKNCFLHSVRLLPFTWKKTKMGNLKVLVLLILKIMNLLLRLLKNWTIKKSTVKRSTLVEHKRKEKDWKNWRNNTKLLD